MRCYYSRVTCAVALALLFCQTAVAVEPSRSKALIGYTHYRTNLPGGRHVNVATMRAYVVRADGSGRRILAGELTKMPHTQTQFLGWSPDGKIAIIGSGWESPENGQWEEEHKRFRYSKEGWLYDVHLLDFGSGKLTNVTAIERVSHLNNGLFFWPGDDTKLGFQALIGGVSHPFVMDRDGKNKKDLTAGKNGFTYGFNSSPDGKRVAYHKSYKIYMADADGSHTRRIKTGEPFNFSPRWSPNGEWLLFVSGKHYDCHPTIVRANGGMLHTLASRGKYRGVVQILDVFDFHDGSSDLPVWSPDSRTVYYTAKVGQSVELMSIRLGGKPRQLTRSPPGTLNYHPQPSPDGRWVVFGRNRQGRRNIVVLDVKSLKTWAVTDVEEGYGAMWPHWQPVKKP